MWLKDNWEPTLGVAGFLIGIVSLWYSIYQRRRNTLDWYYRVNAQILSRHAEDVQSGLAVTYNDLKMTDPRLLVLRFRNTGREDVRDSDYEIGITVDFQESDPYEATVADASTTGIIDSSDLNWVIRGGGGRSMITQPKLFKPGEWFDVRFVVDGPVGKITVSSRYAGQTRAMQDIDARAESFADRFVRIMGLGFLAVALVLLIFGDIDGDYHSWPAFAMFGVVSLLTPLYAWRVPTPRFTLVRRTRRDN